MRLWEGHRLPDTGGAAGFGIVCANLSQAATQACNQLGAALVEIYCDARLPDGAPGTLEFVSMP